MSDIVQRLETVIDMLRNDMTESVSSTVMREACEITAKHVEEARDEIKRLRAAIKEGE